MLILIVHGRFYSPMLIVFDCLNLFVDQLFALCVQVGLKTVLKELFPQHLVKIIVWLSLSNSLLISVVIRLGLFGGLLTWAWLLIYWCVKEEF